ncbi:MAG: dipeptidase [Patescibacteria group bacterium]
MKTARCEAGEAYLAQHQSRFLAGLLEFLRIPSISALPQHAADVRRAAEWAAARLRDAGIEGATVLETGGHPAVFGQWLHAEGKPTLLVYGHLDVQPADPVELWTDPPFQPVVRDGRIYARGASDNKGNMLVPVLAAEAMLQGAGGLPVNLKFLFEGEEEIGSPHLASLVEEHREMLACDLVLNADAGQWGEEQPALLIGLKGLCSLQIDVEGAAADLHSGVYGGTIQNPIHALVRLLDSMRAPDGRILVEGFYDDVVPLTDQDRARIAEVPHDDCAYLRGIGAAGLFGEPGYTTLERAWARPTLELNGIWGGFQGEGVKTVLPREAHAKLTCRLVPDQDPDRITALIISHVARHTPPGVRATARRNSAPSLPYLIPAEHPGNRAASAVLEEIYGRRPYFIRSGGSVAVCGILLRMLGAYSVGFGFALEDEGMHAPNEFYRLESFARGQRAYCRLFDKLAEYTL